MKSPPGFPATCPPANPKATAMPLPTRNMISAIPPKKAPKMDMKIVWPRYRSGRGWPTHTSRSPAPSSDWTRCSNSGGSVSFPA